MTLRTFNVQTFIHWVLLNFIKNFVYIITLQYSCRLTEPIYRHFLEEFLPELLDNASLNVRQQMWLQHDGAPVHFSVGTSPSVFESTVRSMLDWQKWPSFVAL